MKLKHRINNSDFPRDFWNYDINPITGYSLRDKEWREEDDIRKYSGSSIGRTDGNIAVNTKTQIWTTMTTQKYKRLKESSLERMKKKQHQITNNKTEVIQIRKIEL